MRVPDPVDVVVVGGRIAGSLTALRLAARGARVRLLEARGFPSDTLSTHFFRGDGLVRSLDEVGVLEQVLATGAPPLRHEYFSVDGSPWAQGPPQDPGALGYCLSVRRSVLDAILAARAADAGVEVRAHTKVVDLVREGSSVCGVVDAHGTIHRAAVVVGADGRRSTVARMVDAADEQRHPAARAMYYRYATGWRSPDEIGPEFSLVDDDLAYVFPSDGGIACVALSITVRDYESSRDDAAGHLDRRLRAHAALADRLDRLTWVSGLFVGLPAESYRKVAAGPGWALVGDAGTGQDPWAGLGMDAASRQAEAFAEAFVSDPAGTGDYARLREERTLQDFEYATRFAPDLRQMVA